MAFGKSKKNESTGQAPETTHPLETYDVIYRGGLPQLPKAKAGKIVMEIREDRFALRPTTGSRGFWSELDIPYNTISKLEIVDRNVSTFEALAGGLNSRQLNQKNNIHFTFAGLEGEVHLRLEMLSGGTVMGQAKKCAEFEDRLLNLHVREQFVVSNPIAAASNVSMADELNKLVSLKADGALTDEEFSAAKARLLSQP